MYTHTSSVQHNTDEIVYCVQPERTEPDITNAIYLLGSFLVLHLGACIGLHTCVYIQPYTYTLKHKR